ncbi:YebC/PmpR family DNA-binding transcriptional regulator, partial [Anaerospora hongkongensis]
LTVLDAGAEDFKAEEQYEITTAPEDFESVQQALEQNNITTIVAQITMIPETTVELDGDEAVKMVKLIDALEDHDDIQEVYTNVELPDEMME